MRKIANASVLAVTLNPKKRAIFQELGRAVAQINAAQTVRARISKSQISRAQRVPEISNTRRFFAAGVVYVCEWE